MIPASYEGPSNGDYVAYVDKLLRTNPEFVRTQRAIASAINDAAEAPGDQAASPAALLREKLQKIREAAEQAQRGGAARPAARKGSAQTAAGAPAAQTAQGRSKAEAKRRYQEIEREIDAKKAEATPKPRPWIQPFSIFLGVVGIVVSQFSPSFGSMLSLMAFLSLISNVLAKIKGK
ncbi:MAG: hypothetical protein RR473_06295 [Comamonas sp.]